MIKPIQKTKQFIKKHEMAIACGVAAAGASYISQKMDLAVARQFADMMRQQTASKDFMLLDACVFIEEKGLWDEFISVARHYQAA